MPLIPIGEYRPDVSDYQAGSEQGILNVVPRGDGYGPFPSLAAISASLGAQCVGAFEAYKTDGSVVVFAGTSTNLFKLDNTAFTWANVSKAGGPYAGVSPGEQWQFVQFNNLVLAVQGNIVPQVFDISSATTFVDLAGSPPQARYVWIVGRFVVLGGLTSNPNAVQWSGLNDVNGANSWTPGINSADFQAFPDGGFVRGGSGIGGNGGVIFQDTIIRSMVYLPGDPRVFDVSQKIAEDLGIYGPYSKIKWGSSVFFYTLKGFHRFDGNGLAPIGRERVDRTHFTDLDVGSLGLFHGIADPRSSRILWVYKSVNGQVGQFDKALIYDPVLDKFAPARFSGEFLFQMAQPGVTLEALDALFGTNLDAFTVSLDSFPPAAVAELAAFDASHMLNFFRGPNLEATLQTSEQGTDGTRIKEKKGLRPITDSQVVFASATLRENLQQAAVAGTESALNPVGICNMLLDTRYSRFKCRIPAGTVWSFFNGVEPASLKASGKR